MKRFRFRFESVLEVRKNRENEALRSLAEAQGAYQNLLNQKKYFQSELDVSFRRKEELSRISAEIGHHQSEQDYISGTKHRILVTEQYLLRARRRVERGMRGYFEAKKQVRILEALYEKDYSKFREEAKRREFKQQTDLNVMRFRFTQEEEQ